MKNIKMPSKIRKQKLAMLCVGVSPFEKLSFNKVDESINGCNGGMWLDW